MLNNKTRGNEVNKKKCNTADGVITYDPAIGFYYAPGLNTKKRVMRDPGIPRVGFFMTIEEKVDLLNYQIATGKLIVVPFREKFINTIIKILLNLIKPIPA